MLPTSAGVEPATSWSPVGRRIQLSHRGQHLACESWNVKVVLRFLETLDNNRLTLRLLAVKLAILIALTTGQRCQTLKLMNLKNIEINKNYVKIRIGDLLRQSKPQKHLNEFYIEAFDQNEAICVVKVLNKYIEVTQNIRTDSSLFINTQKPHSAAPKSMIAAWIKLGL